MREHVSLTPVQQKFILHWGEMGTRWGISRTVAQVHALLYISSEPLNADQITQTLGVARSNVSTSLRELQGWDIARVVHKLGDRRDYFQTLTDVWELYRIVLDERKRREIDPTIAVLRECVEASSSGGGTGGGAKPGDAYTHERLAELLQFIETMSRWYDQVRKLPRGAFIGLAKAGKLLSRGKEK